MQAKLRIRMCKFSECILSVCLFSIFLSTLSPSKLFARSSVFALFGPGTPSPLVDLIRVKDTKFVNQWDLTLGVNYAFYKNDPWVHLEAELQASQYFDASHAQSYQAAFLVRWLQVPWRKYVNSSFAAGIGLSYATQIPQVERDLEKSSKLLLHLVIEYAAFFDDKETWEALFRIQHRSGIFGTVGDVVGGSDYVCLGTRLHF